ncbi:MAG TPA: ABC transporter permease [bacterium]|jgi:simple sugar transport system permease protein
MSLFDLIGPILHAAVRSGTPLLLAATGEVFAERAGILNLGIEGMMLVGALAGFLSSYLISNIAVALLAAVVFGGLAAFIHAYLTVTLRSDQVVSGLAITLLGVGLTSFLGRGVIGQVAGGIEIYRVPGLSDIPVLGRILFQQDALVYASYAIIPLAWAVLYRTHLGLNIRAVGENPEAADALGVNVALVKYGCVILGGALAGLAGAYLSLAYTTMWVDQMSAGRGWIALALVVFSGWNPLMVAAGAYLFGGMEALQLRMQAVGTGISVHFLTMTPYLVTILFLVNASQRRRKSRPPASLGVPYFREERRS